MKKLFIIIAIAFCATSAFSFDFTSVGSVGPNGTIRGDTSYIVTGGTNPALENQFKQSIFTVGEASFGNTGTFSGAMQYQEQGIVRNGTFLFDSKMGTGSLTIVDQENRISGILQLQAVGVDGKLIGPYGQTGSIYSTAGGLGLQHQTVGVGSLTVGAESVIISGFRTVPAGQQAAQGGVQIHATEVGFEIIEQMQQGFTFGGPLDVKYSVFFPN